MRSLLGNSSNSITHQKGEDINHTTTNGTDNLETSESPSAPPLLLEKATNLISGLIGLSSNPHQSDQHQQKQILHLLMHNKLNKMVEHQSIISSSSSPTDGSSINMNGTNESLTTSSPIIDNSNGKHDTCSKQPVPDNSGESINQTCKSSSISLPFESSTASMLSSSVQMRSSSTSTSSSSSSPQMSSSDGAAAAANHQSTTTVIEKDDGPSNGPVVYGINGDKPAPSNSKSDDQMNDGVDELETKNTNNSNGVRTTSSYNVVSNGLIHHHGSPPNSSVSNHSPNDAKGQSFFHTLFFICFLFFNIIWNVRFVTEVKLLLSPIVSGS